MRVWLLYAGLLASGCTAVGPQAQAGPSAAGKGLQDELATLDTLVAEAKWAGAAEQARSVEAKISERAPLVVENGQALATLPQGFGITTPAPDGVIGGEELYLYAEVRNHGIRETRAGFELDLVSDLIILDESGAELARDEAFAASHFTASAPHRDTFVVVALKTRGLPSGRFEARLVIHDRVGKKTGEIAIPFKIP